jgi:uncharacterized protein (DUF2062 family)
MPQFARYFRKLKADTKRLLRFRAEPSQVALGAAIGVFIGVFPPFGKGILLTMALGARIRFHVPAALLAGTLSIAPPLGTFWILLSAYVGGLRSDSFPRSIPSMPAILSLGADVLLRYLWGCLVVSIFASLVSYGAIRVLFWISRGSRVLRFR